MVPPPRFRAGFQSRGLYIRCRLSDKLYSSLYREAVYYSMTLDGTGNQRPIGLRESRILFIAMGD